MSPPFALLLRGPSPEIFDLSDVLGFTADMSALAVSVFEDAASRADGHMCVQALYHTRKDAQAALAGLTLGPDLTHVILQLPNVDWISRSQAGLSPVRAGRFWIYGSHDADHIPADAVFPIQIDAGLAFGTGHHGTTQGCLLILEDIIKRGADPVDILDLGCGTGVLAIAVAKALGRPVLATDMDGDAVRVTEENASVNDVASAITAVKANGFNSPQLSGRQFDLIFANILAGPLMGLAPDIARALTIGGDVILSGILDEQVEAVTKAFEAEGLLVKPYPSIDGWTSLLAFKP